MAIDELDEKDQHLTQTLSPDMHCCGNCASWDGTRKFIKRFPQGRPSIDTPPELGAWRLWKMSMQIIKEASRTDGIVE
ncbi:MAG: hypothetical protein EBW20_08720 [Betaproteobacteria bacterium]|nr:hypothetical protein [Betaproteobacteria bacterium]